VLCLEGKNETKIDVRIFSPQSSAPPLPDFFRDVNRKAIHSIMTNIFKQTLPKAYPMIMWSMLD